jgi:endonuclease/exonuclease/phosphatase family metal-dependent hydrolase
MDKQFRIATYNIHKARGFDMRIVPERIIKVALELDADILCLQEVLDVENGQPNLNQAHEIAAAFPGIYTAFGVNRQYRGGAYGNLTLSRFPIASMRNHDLSRALREPRGVIQTEIEIAPGQTIQLFNVHLGTGHMERRFQARKLLNREILLQPDLRGPRLVLGDFNEWTHGLTTRMMRTEFQTFRPRHAPRFPRTFPGMLPIFSLDHCYYEPPLHLIATKLWRSRTALIASDHLPLIADFKLTAAGKTEDQIFCASTHTSEPITAASHTAPTKYPPATSLG